MFVMQLKQRGLAERFTSKAKCKVFNTTLMKKIDRKDQVKIVHRSMTKPLLLGNVARKPFLNTDGKRGKGSASAAS